MTERDVQATLRRSGKPGLAADEERLLRMRLGAGVPAGDLLERLKLASDAEIEVLAYEIEAWLALKERAAVREAARPSTRPQQHVSRTKEKIIRALRKKR